MKRITAKEFLAMISENPSVFEHWNTPLEITEHVDCKKSKITHLSKHLTFSAQDRNGDAADFSECENIKTATGTFHGGVWFAFSGIQKIENLIITKPNEAELAASFYICNNLQVATGTYPGLVNFFGSGIHSIQNLHVKKPNGSGTYAEFSNCKNLHSLQNWDLSKKILIEPEKLAAEKERRAIQKFHSKTQPETLPFL
jgi:hypothetical protein